MNESFLVRLPKGDDLLEAIARVFREKTIEKAAFFVIGALDAAVIGFYDPVTREYRNRTFADPLEIVACMGNISLRDGKVFAHAHITVAGEDYRCLGGHLMPGTPIFAAELFGYPVTGEALDRVHDEPTGLALWARF